MTDYKERFKKRFGNVEQFSVIGMSAGHRYVSDDILAFIDEVVAEVRAQEKECRSRLRLDDFAEMIRAEERSSLAAKIEEVLSNRAKELDRSKDDFNERPIRHAELSTIKTDILTHLHAESPSRMQAAPQEETECCCEIHGDRPCYVCPIHKPRTEETEAITGGVIGNGIPKWPRPLITSEETEKVWLSEKFPTPKGEYKVTEKEGASFSGRGEERDWWEDEFDEACLTFGGKYKRDSILTSPASTRAFIKRVVAKSRPKENPTPLPEMKVCGFSTETAHKQEWCQKVNCREHPTPQSREQGTGGDVCAICGRTEEDHSYGSHSHGFVKAYPTNQ